jgi:alpha-L-arabinofuranosidase
MSDLIFEDIGGQEIINIVRNDMINGQNVIYRPIRNLSDINSQYNSNNIIALENTSDSYFKNFPIKLETHVPLVGTGPAPDYPTVYLDDTNGNLIINVVNMASDEQVEVQIVVRGSLLNDTIYEG